MNDLLAALMSVVVFSLMVHLTGLVDRTREVIGISKGALALLQDSSVSDFEKEKSMQKNSVKLFVLLAKVSLATTVALATPYLLLLVAEYLELVSVNRVMEIFLRWDFILGATVLGLALFIGLHRWHKPNS